jgi:hypothetical protein
MATTNKTCFCSARAVLAWLDAWFTTLQQCSQLLKRVLIRRAHRTWAWIRMLHSTVSHLACSNRLECCKKSPRRDMKSRRPRDCHEILEVMKPNVTVQDLRPTLVRLTTRTLKTTICFDTRNSPPPPKGCHHLVVVVALVRLCDPESNAGGSLTTSRATHAGKVKGQSPD